MGVEGVYETRIRCLYSTLSFDGWRLDGVVSVSALRGGVR
jgi:hypothetical protein